MPSPREETLHGYITDMLALEEHIHKAIDAQLAEFEKKYAGTGIALRQMHGQITGHISALQLVADIHEGDAGQTLGDAVKRVGAMLAGLGAAAIDLVRTEKLPKNLRDDYTAFSLAGIGYIMLHTTALALERSDVASLAERHLKDYAGMLMTLQRLIPAAVIEELQSEGLMVAPGVVTAVDAAVKAAWQSAS